MVVIFDWDGTLHDSREAVIQAWIKTGKKFGLKFTRDKVLNCMGPGVEGVSQLLGFPEDVIVESAEMAVDEFDKAVMHTNSLFPKVRETLDELKAQHKLAVYSNGVNRLVNGLIEKYKLEEYFDMVITSETAVKPSRDGIDIILNELGESRGFMVDDAPEGIIAAKNAGIPGIGALYGIDPKRLLLSKPQVLINEVSEVPKVIKDL